MRKIKIVADSTCDLSEELIKKYDIGIVPLCIIMGDKSYFDGLDIMPDDIYRWADANRATPKTSAVTIEKTLEILRPIMAEYEDIIFFGISSKMSTTCNIVSVLAENENYWGMHVIDSLNLSTGIGLQIIKAAEMVKEGIAAETVVERIESDRHKVRASFVIDTLTYLARGGRCTTVTALLANTLKLKPKIIVKNGEMSVDRKYRGSIQTVTMKYAHDLEKELLTADHRRVFITHSGASEAVVNEIRKYLESLKIFDEILETRAGGVISSHCGPNTLGILYYMQ